jgi:hypothetical protein
MLKQFFSVWHFLSPILFLSVGLFCPSVNAEHSYDSPPGRRLGLGDVYSGDGYSARGLPASRCDPTRAGSGPLIPPSPISYNVPPPPTGVTPQPLGTGPTPAPAPRSEGEVAKAEPEEIRTKATEEAEKTSQVSNKNTKEKAPKKETNEPKKAAEETPPRSKVSLSDLKTQLKTCAGECHGAKDPVKALARIKLPITNAKHMPPEESADSALKQDLQTYVDGLKK